MRFSSFIAVRPPAPDGTSPGAVITCFGTVNAEADRQPPFQGRLYTVLFAEHRDALADVDATVRAALKTVPSIGGVR